MKHNILLLMIFIPILVYQLYYTFRYLKEGLNDDLPEFCKGKDGEGVKTPPLIVPDFG